MPTSFSRLAAYCAVATSLLAPFANAQQTHTLLATPSTVAWGYYWSQSRPVLTVNSGDIVVMQTLSTCGAPARLESRGVAAGDIPPYVGEIYDKVPQSERGPGGHILTGPVAIADAEPGDVLEVRVKKVHIDVPWACNGAGKNGFLAKDFPDGYSKIIPLDLKKMTASFSPGITIPLHPFFGSMGIAPPEAAGKLNSAPPGTHAGNMDNKELVEGSTVYIPVHAKGALFEAGDGHAGQGNGEVDITAMETQLTGTFQFILHKKVEGQSPLLWPRAETPEYYIAMGFDPDLTVAAEISIRNMITFLSEQMTDHPRMSREEAYALISVACDVDVTELVDGNKGIHTMCAKSLFAHK
ncbi:MAG TPA: acetamidase/formamidase family protein [Granulicella sp.]|jgi:acetamidase/formamidase|nr:acetamidase/formamidase family protein [Granulicella sp.]